MFKRIYSYIIILAGSLLFMVACNEEDDKIEKFTSNVDVTNSTFKGDKYSMTLKFSTDNGSTWVDYPVVKLGQSYKVKVVDQATAADVTADDCVGFDWSSSNPAPTGESTSNVAEFVMKQTNELKVLVATPALDAAKWTGTFSALEDYGSAGTYGPYDVTIAPVAGNPNQFTIDNFYDSGLKPYIEFDGVNFTVKFPNQTTGGKPITASSGSYNQCTGELELHLNYDGGNWVYYLEKK